MATEIGCLYCDVRLDDVLALFRHIAAEHKAEDDAVMRHPAPTPDDMLADLLMGFASPTLFRLEGGEIIARFCLNDEASALLSKRMFEYRPRED